MPSSAGDLSRTRRSAWGAPSPQSSFGTFFAQHEGELGHSLMAGPMQEPVGTALPLHIGSEATRLEHIFWWIKQQGWSSMAFDRLVLHLDRLGIELTISEQDHLKRGLYRGSGAMYQS
mmetsp:Transcript_34355/g.97433  ORF Transcript_34355/g.97433 Transcript_34355/m.97433 type:complete len:118 (+) Transcript_34355:1-354(+)